MVDHHRMLDYLAALRDNNNREWFHAHKQEYQAAKNAFEGLLAQLMPRLEMFEPGIMRYTPSELTFKIMRDTRFSNDKSPYNPAFRAHLSPAGKAPVPVGFYLMIKPGNQSFLGGGLFTDMFKDATTMVRNALIERPEAWKNIIHASDFQPVFPVRGTTLKNVPRGYDPEHPLAEYLRMKSWYVEYPLTDQQILAEDTLLNIIEDIFRRMKPLNDFLNTALQGFQMPQR